MKYYNRVFLPGFIFFFLGINIFSQHVIIESNKIPYENDSVILVVNGVYRGNIQWEVSKDKYNWTTITGQTSGTLHLRVDSTAYYRAAIIEGTCDPVYSDTALVAELYDERDNRAYDVVKIGMQWWMAENLDYYTDNGTWYYDDDSISNHLYGRLYTWHVTSGLCPEGWHLPKDDEWKVLESELGMSSSELDSTDWRGTDEGDQLKKGGSSGFDLLFGGFRDELGTFQLFNAVGTFWAASEYDDDKAWHRGVGSGSQIHRDIYDKQMAFSIRCLKDIPPISTTDRYHSLTRASAMIDGTVISDGGQEVTERGFCWSTSQNPTIQDDHIPVGLGIGEYTGFISILAPNTKYYIRTYAINSKGTAYGNAISLTTPQYSVPTLTTKPLSDITQTTATTGGSVLDDGGRTITDKGVCWSLSPNPITSDNSISEGSGFNDFSTEITNLEINHTYYVRAYAVNSEGTKYANEIQLTTLPVNPVDTLTDIRDGQSYKMVKIGNQWWMAENLNFYTKPGSWYYDADSLNNFLYGRLYNWETAQSACPVEWHLPTDKEWKTLEKEVGMSQAEADATGLRGTDQGDQLKIGQPSGFDIIYSGYRDPAGSFNTLNSGATFWTSSEETGSDSWYRGFDTGSQIHRDIYDKDYGFSIRCVRNLYPVVSTIPVDSVGKTYARSGGIITYDGGFPVTAYGVCWSTSHNPTEMNDHTVDGSGTATYTSIITGLETSKTYYLRAYATNSVGTSYGDEEVFTTITVPVLTTTVPGSITVNSARSGGTITDDGGDPLLTRGVCWSKFPEPTIFDSITIDGSEIGSYESIVTGLQINTTYYIRAYAINSKGPGYGNEYEFTTLPTNKTGTFYDPRDGKTYKTVKIGLQWWLAENLNYVISSSWCYNDIGSLCDSLGRLYSWNSAQNSCPDDWHLASDNEWKILETGLGMNEAEADNTGLRGTDQGTQLKKGGSSGFDVLFGGIRDNTGTFNNLNTGGAFWTSSEGAVNEAWYRGFPDDPYIHRDTFNENYGFSVRCIKDTLPVVITNIVDSVGKTYARCGGNVTFDTGLPVTAKGVCWSTSHNPTTDNSSTDEGIGLGAFTSIMTGLSTNETYYVRAYATTSAGTGYGEEFSFLTVTDPIVVTSPVSSVNETTASCGGNVTDGGGLPVTARGVCWSTNTDPSIADICTSNGIGTGSYISYITGLTPNTVYYLRAYATNSKGTGYGDQISFETDPVNETGSFTDPRNSKNYETVKIGDQWWMAENLNYVMANSWCYDNSSENCDTLGRLYSWSSATNSCPSGWHLPTDDEWKTLEIELGMQEWEADITGLRGSDQGTQLKKGGSSGFDMIYSGFRYPDGTYSTFGSGATVWTSTEDGSSAWYRGFIADPKIHRDIFSKNYGFSVRCLKIESPVVFTSDMSAVTDSSAVGGGEVTYDGGAPVTARGVCWSTSHDPTIADETTNNGVAIGSFVSTLTDLLPNTDYYVRAYATNSAGTGYGDEVEFTTEIGIPRLTTYAVTAVTDSSAQSGGTITRAGGATITAKGVCWSISPDPDIITGDITLDGTGTSSFVSIMKILAPDTKYYVRAYATNIEGTGYGGEEEFTTITGKPRVITTSLSLMNDTSVQSGGNVTYDGGEIVTARGVCWSTLSTPTIADNTTCDGTGTGVFTSQVNGLSLGTHYYLRAYATNVNGTTYGGELEFTTTATFPTVTTATPETITDSSATSGGNVTNEGGTPVTARGVCWSTSADPTINDDSTNNGQGTGAFISAITGLSHLTEYHVRAYATNSAGTAYGDDEKTFTTKYKTDTLLDIRDSAVYNTVMIGTQWWMAENLHFYVDSGTWYYGDDSTNNVEYGRLYNWNTAMAGADSSSTNPSEVQGVCPSGWHMPSDAEWTELTDKLGGLSVAGGKMKEEGLGHWFPANTGATNESGFTALPAGERLSAGGFQNQTSQATFWSTSLDTGTNMWIRRLIYNSAVAGNGSQDKTLGFSVRCIKD